MNNEIDELLEQDETGTAIIDKMFEKYLIRYVNVHFKKFKNSFEVGEWFLMEVLTHFMKTRVSDKARALTGLRLLIKDKSIQRLIKELGEYNEN
jgi:hypothetical protein